MTLFSYHYLVVSFFISVWLGYPTSFFVVIPLHYVVQTILWASGLDLMGLTDIFWGYQGLVTLLGILVAKSYSKLMQPLPLLKIEAGYEGSFIKFFISLAAFLGSQLLYSEFPPPNSSFGIIFSMLTSFIILMGTWYSLTFVEKAEHNRPMFFMGWFLVIAAMQLMFYFTYTGLDETWAAMIAAAPPLIVLGIMNCMKGTWQCLTCT